MENYKCPLCNRKSSQPINLRCDHHPCFHCASQILAVDHESPLETKYRIVCPICYKKTITLDLRHLIISATEQDEDMYVTTKYIAKKPEPPCVKKAGYGESGRNSVQGKHHPTVISTANTGSNAAKTVAIACKRHTNHNLQYFCEDCSQKSEPEIYFCSECAKSHKHRLTPIHTATDKIQHLTQKRKQAIFTTKYEYLGTALTVLRNRKQSISMEYETLYREIAQQFKSIYQQINEQYESTKRELKAMHARQYEDIKNNIALVEKFQESIEELDKISEQGYCEVEAQVQLSMCVIQIERAVEGNIGKIGEKFELPKIVRRGQVVLASGEKIVDIQLGSKERGRETPSLGSSRPITPTNSARFFNYSMEGSKNSSRPETKGPDLAMFKQNFNPIVSPRNYFSNKQNI